MNSCSCDVCTHPSSAIRDHIDCLNQGKSWNADTCSVLAFYGNLEAIKFVRERGCPWDSQTTTQAASEGNLEMLVWLHQNECPWDVSLYKETAISDCYFRQHSDFSEHSNPFLFIASSNNDYLECVKYAYENGCDLTSDPQILLNAAQGGNLEMFKWLYYYGHVDLKNHEYNDICLYVVCCEHYHKEDELVELLKFAHEQGFPWSEVTCSNSADRGHFRCLKYAHENGCPWDSNTCKSAYQNDQTECLVYAFRNNCPGREEYFDSIFEDLLMINLSILTVAVMLKIWIIRFRKRYYSPNGHGFFTSKEHFTKSIH